jgi:hypothetical protein
MNILYCVLHTKHQEARANNILSTWGKNTNILFYSDHDDPTINCYKVTDKSDYSSGQIKQIDVFQLLLKKYNNYDWYFFCDNDTFVNISRLENFATTANINAIHGEIINCWPEDKSLYYPSGGAGYLLSKKILHILTNLHYNNTQYSDVSMGINIKEKKIPLIHHDLFKSQPPKFYNIENRDIKHYISFHYIVDLHSMQNLYQNVK